MYRRQLNHARLRIALVPRGPILIKSGIESPDPTLPDMAFVRTHHARFGKTVYLPGSSLKGLLRSQAERLLSGLGLKVRDPFEPRPRLPKQAPSAQVFTAQCPIAQTFGSLQVGGRLNVADAYPWPWGDGSEREERLRAAREAANTTEKRTQVSIDRRTGSSSGTALFDLEVVTQGKFYAEIYLENFQLWQLGLVEVALRDVHDGYAPVGFGKSRGLGQVDVERHELVYRATATPESGGKVGHFLGSGDLVSERDVESYGLHHPDGREAPAAMKELRSDWLGWELRAEGDGDVAEALDAAVAELGAFVTARRERPQRAGEG